jgi:hypothetical protein
VEQHFSAALKGLSVAHALQRLRFERSPEPRAHSQGPKGIIHSPIPSLAAQLSPPL